MALVIAFVRARPRALARDARTSSLEITAAGHAKLKRGAAPEPEQFQAQHREVEEAGIERMAR